MKTHMLRNLLMPLCVGLLIFIQFWPLTVNARSDSTQVQLRVPPAENIQRYAEDEKFIYGSEQQGETLSARIQRWLWDKIFSIIRTPWVRSMLEITFYLTFVVVLLALLNQLLKENIKTAFSGNSLNERIAFGEEEIHAKQQDLDRMLRESLDNNDFDRAVRLLYQKSLRKLADAGLISWQPDKTNHEYLNELSSHPVYAAFSALTRFYEYVEYGDFHIKKNRFESIKKYYSDFEAGLNHE